MIAGGFVVAVGDANVTMRRNGGTGPFYDTCSFLSLSLSFLPLSVSFALCLLCCCQSPFNFQKQLQP